MPSITGLTAAEVNARRAAGQTNTPPKSQTKTTGEIVRDNICTYFNLVFLVLASMDRASRRSSTAVFMPPSFAFSSSMVIIYGIPHHISWHKIT